MKKLITITFAALFSLNLHSAMEFKLNPDLEKVDHNGNFKKFPGVSIVALIENKEREFWQKIYDRLAKSSLIKNYYALLPVESYHLTAINLFSKKSIRKNWKNFVTAKLPMFQNINKKLESDEFHPQITIIKPSVADTIKLIVKLNKDEKRRIQKWSKEFDLEENVPNPFHITLGYLYRNIPKEIRIAILAQVQKITKDAIGGYHQLEFPKLTFFKDMLEFVSWDGQTNPF